MTERSDDEEVAAWAASGAMALTGRRSGEPLGPPAGLVPALRRLGALLAERSSALGAAVRLDPLALLGERAAIAGLRRAGETSCGGGTRLVRAADGWLAVSLARPEDIDLVPAWLAVDGPVLDGWALVTDVVARSSLGGLVERAMLVGLPVAALAEHTPPTPALPGSTSSAVRATPMPGTRRLRPMAELCVVDLTALWAGPLCGSILLAAGAEVVKVESTRRPDGARLGPPAFYDLLNAGKRSVAVDLQTDGGRREFQHLVSEADVVIEASRPRALAQLGVAAEAVMGSERGPQVWVSITGHGRTGPGRDRPAFGDDAAVAGGLVVHDEIGPCFCADAVADPITGLVAATAALEAIASGRRWLLDVPMAGVAATLAGPTLGVGSALSPSSPRARPVVARAVPLGHHNPP